MLEQKLSKRMRSGWLAASCAVALGCFCLTPSRSIAQSDASGNASPNTTSQTKTASPKKSGKLASNPSTASASTAKAKTATGKAHATSHTSTGSHAKSSAAARSRSKSASSGQSSSSKSKRKTGKGKTVARGQQKIDPERVQAIQEALIREHYLSETAGTWNQASEDAMRRYQADHGWQSKTVPDARALITLGLGPRHDHLLNPETAMTMEPGSPQAASIAPTSHSADPGAPAKTNSAPASPPPAASGPAHNPSSPQ
jgi:hypothetical protein